MIARIRCIVEVGISQKAIGRLRPKRVESRAGLDRRKDGWRDFTADV